MRVAIRAICRPTVARGLALAGLDPIEVETGERAGSVLGDLSRAPDRGGVVLIERALLDEVPRTVRRQLDREGAPVVLSFPSPSIAGAARPEDELLEILRQAIGYRVRLR